MSSIPFRLTPLEERVGGSGRRRECRRPDRNGLRGADHNVIYVRELDPGIDDARVLEMANSHGALLLTSDKDFGELVFRQGLIHAGVILYRLAGLATERKAGVLLSVLQTHGDALRGAFTLVSPTQVRIRPRLSESR